MPVWSLSTIGSINKLESVQRSFAERFPGMRSLSHEDRLRDRGLERLKLRCLHILILLCVIK